MNTPSSPYSDQGPHAFWRTAVVKQDSAATAMLHQPRFPLTQNTAIMTAGSCFAQHLHRKLEAFRWNVINTEDARATMSKQIAKRYAYGQYSARYGNIYTARQWVELLREALDDAPSPTPIWEKEGRFYDALRPSVEPNGLASPGEVMQARQAHLHAVRTAVQQADCVIFTLGLTEAWIDRATGRCVPTAPGTLAGDMVDTPADFVNFGFVEVMADMAAARDILHSVNPRINMLLTVSPVPLTATATQAHVVQASTTSKAILRTACDALLRTYADIDYFPSYEIITTPVLGGPFFRANQRTPSEGGVARVLDVFAQSYGAGGGAIAQPDNDDPLEDAEGDQADELDVICEDILLDMFAK